MQSLKSQLEKQGDVQPDWESLQDASIVNTEMNPSCWLCQLEILTEDTESKQITVVLSKVLPLEHPQNG